MNQSQSQASEPEWVPPELVRGMHLQQLQEHGGLRGAVGMAALEAALGRPKNRFAYGGEDIDLADLAAAYVFGLATSHPFVDGNKRTAYLAAMVFLDLNGYDCAAPTEEIIRLMLGVADGSMEESQLAAWIRARMEPLLPEA